MRVWSPLPPPAGWCECPSAVAERAARHGPPCARTPASTRMHKADLPLVGLLPLAGRAWGTMESRTPELVATLVRRQGCLRRARRDLILLMEQKT